MNKKDIGPIDRKIYNLVLQELEQNPYRNFSIIFALTSIIPFLLFFYVLVGRLFSFGILVGNIGLTLFISISISAGGYCIGYQLIKNILNRIMFYAAKAKHSDQLKSTLISTITHDLRNPLFVLRLGLADMSNSSIDKIDEEQKELLNRLRNVVDRMDRLTNNLLGLLKFGAGIISMERKLCDFAEILESQLKEFEFILNNKRIQLNKEISGKELFAWADEDKITQVVNNLLSNAIKYNPEGGSITLKAYLDDANVRMEFIDSGPGIPPDKLEKIFDQFQRVDSKTKGTGLGLAITKNIVELHKGKIWVESQPGKGSKFIVILPRDLRKR